MPTLHPLFGACLAIAMICMPGCQSEDTASKVLESSPATHAHDHPTEGLHHGTLIELGNDDYHAELVHDDESITVYLSKAAADEPVPIDATEITINMNRDGTPSQFQLAASPDANDPDGKSSRFVSSDADLVRHIDEEGVEPRLVVLIDGKAYRGEIKHRHDRHGDHGH